MSFYALASRVPSSNKNISMAAVEVELQFYLSVVFSMRLSGKENSVV